MLEPTSGEASKPNTSMNTGWIYWIVLMIVERGITSFLWFDQNVNRLGSCKLCLASLQTPLPLESAALCFSVVLALFFILPFSPQPLLLPSHLCLPSAHPLSRVITPLFC